MGKWSPEARARHSKVMSRFQARRRRDAKKEATMVFDYTPEQVHKSMAQQIVEHAKTETRFPLSQYAAVVDECNQIIAQRDASGRNSYLSFWEGFPHGLADITFEAHRRVARVLGVERQLANGHAGDAKELKQVMRNDLLDLANYALFGVMKLDKDATELV